jgi:hypothetical protein
MRRALVVIVACLAAAPAADAYSVGGRAWPDGTFTYYTQARAYSGAVNRAARLLNRAGLAVSVRRAPSRSAADVIVAYGGNPWEGEATVGRGTPNHCRHRSLAYWLSHPLTADDKRGLRAIYG